MESAVLGLFPSLIDALGKGCLRSEGRKSKPCAIRGEPGG